MSASIEILPEGSNVRITMHVGTKRASLLVTPRKAREIASHLIVAAIHDVDEKGRYTDA